MYAFITTITHIRMYLNYKIHFSSSLIDYKTTKRCKAMSLPLGLASLKRYKTYVHFPFIFLSFVTYL